jgi:putative endopeptidase
MAKTGNKGKKRSSSKKSDIGFSIENMDRKVDPLVDFYSYANGSWIRKNEVPDDKVSLGSFVQLLEKNQFALKAILERCSEDSEKRTRFEKMCGDFYYSMMDVERIEKSGIKPVLPYLKKVSSVKSREDISSLIAYFDLLGIPTFIGSAMGFVPRKSMPDKKDSSVYALYLNQGGLSLPDRDYYLSPSFSEMVKKYKDHITRMFILFGDDKKSAEESAEAVLAIEKDLAEKSRSRADLRDQEKNYNKMSLKEISKKYKGLDFDRYIYEVDLPPVKYAIVGQPEFLTEVSSILTKADLNDLKAYFRWKVINYFAPYLNEKIEKENFDFFKKELLGQKRQEPRWKRAIVLVDSLIGEALGSLFIDEYFSDETRKRMNEMLEDIKGVFRERLEKNTWMTEKTKKRALAKFSKFRAKIGHPAKFKEYKGLRIKRDDLIGNITRSTMLEIRRQINRVGEPVDREEWMMTPPTVNAYFNPSGNEIVFPAGIIQPPFFDPTMDDAVNYGGIGGVIAHEITHGFDDQGRQFDEDGNLRNWWSHSDLKHFNEAAEKVVKLYGSLEPIKGFKVNGKLTLGENIADLGAVTLAFEALKRHLKKHPELNKKIDGLTPEQRFFISWANVWRGNIREGEIKRRVLVDPHSPAKFRGSVPVINHPDFEVTFGGKSSGREKIGVW